jgi:hypothetical protein
MFLDSVIHLTELLVLILTGMMIRRMIRLYRAHTAFVPTAPADRPDPNLSVARPVTPRKATPPPTSATVLESYIDELLGTVDDSVAQAEPAVSAPQPPARLNVPLSRSPRKLTLSESGAQPEPAYQPIATILSKRCDVG